MTRSRFLRPALLAVAAALATVTLGGGVAEALPLDGDIGSPSDGVPILGSPTDGLPIVGDEDGPRLCSVTVADPRRSRGCNDRGGNGRDGAAGSVGGRRSGHQTGHHGSVDRYRDDQRADLDADPLGPDVNGAPGRPGSPRPLVPPGSAP